VTLLKNSCQCWSRIAVWRASCLDLLTCLFLTHWLLCYLKLNSTRIWKAFRSEVQTLGVQNGQGPGLSNLLQKLIYPPPSISKRCSLSSCRHVRCLANWKPWSLMKIQAPRLNFPRVRKKWKERLSKIWKLPCLTYRTWGFDNSSTITSFIKSTS
jgi:hypothetical protein